MRFTSFHIEGFGRLRDWNVEALDPGLVVVLGPNEAGKSSLFRFLTAMLYGIYPADAERNPYVPWGGRTGLAGTAHLALNDGTSVAVHRRLGRQPQGALEYIHWPEGEAGEPTVLRREELRNRALPATTHIPLRLFEDIFALTLEQMRFPSDQAWSLIHDRLLGHLGSDAFRPISRVLDELRQEALALWRPNRRGQPRDRQLEQAMNALREQRQAAAERDREIREAHHQLNVWTKEREGLRARQVEVEAFLRRATRLAPIRSTLRAIDELQRTAGNLEPWQHLPDDPVAVMESLAQDVRGSEEREADLKRDISRYEEQVRAFTPADQWLLERDEGLQEAVADLGRLKQLEERVHELAQAQQRLHHRLADHARRLLVEPWSEDIATAFAEVPEPELRSRLQTYRTEDQRFREAAARSRAVQAHEIAPIGGLSAGWAALIMLAGIVLTFIGGAGVIDLLLWGGLLLTLFGALQLWVRWQERSRQRRERTQRRRLEHEAAMVEREAAELRDEALRHIEILLRDIPVAPSRLENPDETLLLDIQQIQFDLRGLEDLKAEERRLLDDMEAARRELRHVFEEVAAAGAVATAVEVDGLSPTIEGGGVEAYDDALADEAAPSASGKATAIPAADWTEVEKTIRGLPACIEEARERRREAAHARQRLEELEDHLARLRAERKATIERMHELEAAMAELGASFEEQAAALDHRRRAAREAAALEEHLRREHPDLETIKAEIAAAEQESPDWRITDEAIVAAEMERDELSARLEKLADDMGRLRAHVKTLEAQVTLDQVDGELDALAEEREKVRRRRDRLALLGAILQEADRRFRDEHQPDVLRRAGEYLGLITGGRYVRLFLEPGEQGERLTLQARDNPFPYDVEKTPISRGTLDQIYLALRFALIDHLDADHEPLPLFLDEILVNWDKERRGHALALLDHVSAHRQVFLFTCHRWLADEVADHVAAQRIVMPGTDGGSS